MTTLVAFQENLTQVLIDARNVEHAAVCVGGLADELPPLPGLAIRRDGAADEAFRRVPLPIDDMNADFLRSCGRASAYGKGLETHVDARVRSCTELLPAQFRFDHPRWQHAIDELVARAYDSLRGYENVGVAKNDSLVAEPYKLLLYSTGDHFLAHRDTEKSPGMFATLIVQLPSLCAGGDLLVRFGGVETAHLFGRDTGVAEYECHFAMHYADVEHELRRIESGHRLAVVFNVCWRGAVPLPPSQMSSATAFDTVQPLVSALSMWPRDLVPVVVLPLDHLYTHDGLSGRGVAALKGADRDLAQLVQSAADKYPMRLFVLSMELKELEYGHGPDEYNIDWHLESATEQVDFCFDADGRSAAFMTRCHRLEPLSAYVVPPPENDDFWDSTVDTDAYINLGNEGATRTTTYARCALLLLPVVDGNALDALLEVGEFEAGVDEFRRAPSLSTFAELCRWCAQQSRLEWIASDVVDLLEFAARNDCALELLCTLAQHVPYSVDRRFVASVARASLSSGGGVDLLVPIVRRLARTLTSGAVADVLNQFSEPVETVRAVLEAVDATASIASEDGAALAQALARVAHASLVEPIGRLLLVLQGSDERLECIRALWDHADAGALRPMLLDTMRAHPLANVPHAVALLQLCCALIDDERLIDSVVVERVLAPPLRSTLLVPLIEELIKLNVNCDALHRLCRARIDDLDRLLAPGAPVFSWSLPVAYGVDRADLQAFMRDSERSQAVLSNFNSIHDARSAARRWSCAMPLRCVASGAGKHARVSVEKTRSAHQAAVDAYQRNVAEKQRLEQWMQVARGASRKRARAVDIDNKDEQHDA